MYMYDSSDLELLRQYARGAEDSFAELVRRHIPLVYSVALRHVGSTAHAEEITQAVFVILAQKSGQMRALASSSKAGWVSDHAAYRLQIPAWRTPPSTARAGGPICNPPFRNPTTPPFGTNWRRCSMRPLPGWASRTARPSCYAISRASPSRKLPRPCAPPRPPRKAACIARWKKCGNFLRIAA